MKAAVILGICSGAVTPYRRDRNSGKLIHFNFAAASLAHLYATNSIAWDTFTEITMQTGSQDLSTCFFREIFAVARFAAATLLTQKLDANKHYGRNFR